MKKVLLIGPLSPPISGPGVKNAMLYSWLNKSTDIKINILNTNDYRGFHFFTVLKGIYNFLITQTVILSVSKNGRFLIIPFCFLFRKKVVLFPAGGSFDIEINNLNSFLRDVYLYVSTCIQTTYVQTNSLKTGLESLKFKDVRYFPNPRVNRSSLVNTNYGTKTFKIVFLSKIREGKGPILLINAVENVRRKHEDYNIYLDFYGLIDSEFSDDFIKALNISKNNIYCGVVEPEKVQKTISGYDLFVLPSLFPEGVPGAVVEAMFTGIPIIISDFDAANDLINNERNGFIVPQNDIKSLELAIEKLLLNKDTCKAFSEEILKKSDEFNYDRLMKEFESHLIKI